MKQVNFNKKQLAATISLLLGTSFLTPVFAAEESAPVAKSIVAEVEDVPTPKTTKSRKKKAPVKKDGSELDDILSQFDEVDD